MDKTVLLAAALMNNCFCQLNSQERKNNCLFTFPGATLQRWFLEKSGFRQNSSVVVLEVIRSVAECSIKCIENAEECVGFNFKQGNRMCELCHVPHDAPNSDMLLDPNWNHYAIMPWTENDIAPSISSPPLNSIDPCERRFDISLM